MASQRQVGSGSGGGVGGRGSTVIVISAPALRASPKLIVAMVVARRRSGAMVVSLDTLRGVRAMACVVYPPHGITTSVRVMRACEYKAECVSAVACLRTRKKCCQDSAHYAWCSLARFYDHRRIDASVYTAISSANRDC